MEKKYIISVKVSSQPEDGSEEDRIQSVHLVVGLATKPNLSKIAEKIKDQINDLLKRLAVEHGMLDAVMVLDSGRTTPSNQMRVVKLAQGKDK